MHLKTGIYKVVKINIQPQSRSISILLHFQEEEEAKIANNRISYLNSKIMPKIKNKVMTISRI